MSPARQSRADRRSEFRRGLAKHLRTHPTDAERKLWVLLRSKQVLGIRFRRQHPLGPYIADFYCPAAKLIVELDGGQHGADLNFARDVARTDWMEKRGYRVLRFNNGEFLKNSQDALERICLAIGPLPGSPAAIRPSRKGRVE